MSMNEGAETKVGRTMVAGIHLDETIAAAGGLKSREKKRRNLIDRYYFFENRQTLAMSMSDKYICQCKITLNTSVSPGNMLTAQLFGQIFLSEMS